MGMWSAIKEKFNPAQPRIAEGEGHSIHTNQNRIHSITNAYNLVEVVNRCVNLIVDNAAMINFDVSKNSLKFTSQVGSVKHDKVSALLNVRPNPYMDISTFRRLLLMDFLIDGNCFIYFDGTSLYHLPARRVEVKPDSKTYVNSFMFDSTYKYAANEVIYIRDNSMTGDLYRGSSRINSALGSILTKDSMVQFQKSFFENGASVGLILETDNPLSPAMMARKEQSLMRNYNPKRSGGRPLILDNGLKAKSIANTNFRELAFTEATDGLDKKVAMSLGVPPILLDTGNNANIKPNLELMFSVTILPMLRKFEAAFEYFFAYDTEVSTHRVPALKPDQKELADRLTALVNNGIITGNEAREELRLEPIDDENMNTIRIPANVAGSATGVTGQEGGKPPNEED